MLLSVLTKGGNELKPNMPYCTGEVPMVGDAVSDKDRRLGTVTHIIHYGAGPAELLGQVDQNQEPGLHADREKAG
jgi:hypothetical protein